MTFWKSKDFKTLQKSWYQRLEAKGFQDIEKLVGDELVLKQSASNAYKGADDLSRENKGEYFNIISQHVCETKFANEVDELVMKWHAEGKKINAICKYLEWLGETRCRNTICFTIRKYEMKWGIRQYTPQQLNKKVK